MLFFVFLSLVAILDLLSLNLLVDLSRRPGCRSRPDGSFSLGASRLGGSHLGDSMFVDLDDVPSWVCATREALEPFRSPRDDRVGVGTGLDRIALFDLPVEKDVEASLARPERLGFSHECEYRRGGSSAIFAPPCPAVGRRE
jgi:hypothetical protein